MHLPAGTCRPAVRGSGLALLLLASFAAATLVQGASAVQYSFLGCFGDNQARAIPTQLIQSDSSIMTVELCAQAAQTNGYTIFGLQVGKEPCLYLC